MACSFRSHLHSISRLSPPPFPQAPPPPPPGPRLLGWVPFACWPTCDARACAAGRANCWKWLQGDFSLVRVVNGLLCKTSLYDIWAAWKAFEFVQVNLLNQLVAHSVCRVPVARQELVPGSEAAGTPTSWQDLEEAGLAFMVPPGRSSGQFGPITLAVAAARTVGPRCTNVHLLRCLRPGPTFTTAVTQAADERASK